MYAQYHGILDSRNLGGAAGTLDGAFAAKHLLQSDTLGDYVQLVESKLDSCTESDMNNNSASINGNEEKDDGFLVSNSDHNVKEKKTDPLYESLLEAITLGYTA